MPSAPSTQNLCNRLVVSTGDDKPKVPIIQSVSDRQPDAIQQMVRTVVIQQVLSFQSR